jgi:hypothetical protein
VLFGEKDKLTIDEYVDAVDDAGGIQAALPACGRADVTCVRMSAKNKGSRGYLNSMR